MRFVLIVNALRFSYIEALGRSGILLNYYLVYFYVIIYTHFLGLLLFN